ncbi:MAG: AMIN domain-containing protein [Nitrospirae bacterium]|nr:MAG: AMIN domain-containing protein [Nitrospirota bacterium]
MEDKGWMNDALYLRGKAKIVFLCGLLVFFVFSFTPFVNAAGRAGIKDIKYQSFKGYTRVTINLSGPVEFSMKHLSKPERLYFDLKNTTVSRKTRTNLVIGNTVLKAIRTNQFSKDTVRIVFDLGKAEDFKASLLNKPSRLVVDIYASRSTGKEPDIAAPAKTEKTDTVSAVPEKKPDAIPTPEKPEAPPKAKEPEPVSAGKNPELVSPPPEKPEIKPSAPIKPEASAREKWNITGKGIIKNIRSQSFKDYTRVVVYLSGPVEFTKNRISKPERLYFDLKATTLSKKVKAVFNVGDGILKAVRARQFNKDTVRIVLDVQRMEDFKVSALAKPTRLVVDIYSSKPDKKEPVAALPEQIKKPEITPPPLTKVPEVTTPVAKKEPDVIPQAQKPELIMPKQDAADYLSSGEKHVESGEHEKALLDFKKAAELNPRSAETYVAIGRSLFKIGKKDEALEAYKGAIERDPKSAEAYNGLGYSYYSQGKAGSAIEAFLKAIELDPEHDDAHAGLGYTYLTIGDTNSAIEQYRILKSLDSNKADELFRLIFKEQQNKEQTKTLETKPSGLK